MSMMKQIKRAWASEDELGALLTPNVDIQEFYKLSKRRFAALTRSTYLLFVQTDEIPPKKKLKVLLHLAFISNEWLFYSPWIKFNFSVCSLSICAL